VRPPRAPAAPTQRAEPNPPPAQPAEPKEPARSGLSSFLPRRERTRTFPPTSSPFTEDEATDLWVMITEAALPGLKNGVDIAELDKLDLATAMKNSSFQGKFTTDSFASLFDGREFVNKDHFVDYLRYPSKRSCEFKP
jgi:hypothetical protein